MQVSTKSLKLKKKDIQYILHGNRKENPKIHVKADKIPNGHRTPEAKELRWRDGQDRLWSLSQRTRYRSQSRHESRGIKWKTKALLHIAAATWYFTEWPELHQRKQGLQQTVLCKLAIHTQMDEIRPVFITLWKNELQLDLSVKAAAERRTHRKFPTRRRLRKGGAEQDSVCSGIKANS